MTEVKLTSNERRALAGFKGGKVDWNKVHGRTRHALQRKKLIEGNPGNRPGWRLTTAGKAALAVPNIFDDLFDQKNGDTMHADKHTTPTKAQIARERKANAALARLQTVSIIEIDTHPLLDTTQRKLCKVLRNAALRDQVPFTMLAFAEIALRATGNDYAAVTDEGGPEAAKRDQLHRHAAILYVYEAVKAGPPIIAETAEERGTLKDLELLVSYA